MKSIKELKGYNTSNFCMFLYYALILRLPSNPKDKNSLTSLMVLHPLTPIIHILLVFICIIRNIIYDSILKDIKANSRYFKL